MKVLLAVRVAAISAREAPPSDAATSVLNKVVPGAALFAATTSLIIFVRVSAVIAIYCSSSRSISNYFFR